MRSDLSKVCDVWRGFKLCFALSACGCVKEYCHPTSYLLIDTAIGSVLPV
jgi:hypothetical protein